MTVWAILFAPFVLILLIAVTHVYFGLHVLARGIIFVDLALAQIAAVGASLAFLLGYDGHGAWAQAAALAAALLASLAFAQLRRVPDTVTREVVIGCAYVVAVALSIMILSRSVTGMEELKTLLNGNILWVGWRDIALLAAVYAAVGAIHVVWRHRFLELSRAGERAGGRALAWETLFFTSFAVVITLAVMVAGVLVVFALLIIPAFSATLLARGFARRLAAGWALAALGCGVGLALAYVADLPVGAAVVSVLGLVPVTAAVLSRRSGPA
ncbi:MAG TPA: metal ABC transporter permease [Alphaproteobacteria bacterium]